MKYRIVDLLKCQCGNGDIELKDPICKTVPFDDSFAEVRCKRNCSFMKSSIKEGVVAPDNCMQCYGQEVMEGAISCRCGRTYPIIGGIPRFLEDTLETSTKKIQETFSSEWKMFRFGERNWGQDITYRKKMFLQGMGVEPGDLSGKLIFDGGCGSGLLAMEMAKDFKMEVIALDLACGIEKAYEYNKNPYVHFMQGSVLSPPVQDQAMDYVYCAGVLVHLPDTRTGFQAIIKTLKKGGRCFIWVYHPIDSKHHPQDRVKMLIYTWIRKYITSPLPIGVQYYVYLSVMPMFLVKRTLSNLLGPGDNRTWREKMQALFDMFSPIYQNRHTHEEVKRWFLEERFTNATNSDIGAYGFGTYGDFVGK